MAAAPRNATPAPLAPSPAAGMASSGPKGGSPASGAEVGSAPPLPPRPPGLVVWKQAVVVFFSVCTVVLPLAAGDVLGALGRAGLPFPVVALFLIPVVVGLVILLFVPLAMIVTRGWAAKPDCPGYRTEPCRCLEDGCCACRAPRGRKAHEAHLDDLHTIVHSTSRGVRVLETAVAALATRLEETHLRKRSPAGPGGQGEGPDDDDAPLFQPTLLVQLSGSEDDVQAEIDRLPRSDAVVVRLTTSCGCQVLTARSDSVQALTAWRDEAMPRCRCAVDHKLVVHAPPPPPAASPAAAAEDDAKSRPGDEEEGATAAGAAAGGLLGPSAGGEDGCVTTEALLGFAGPPPPPPGARARGGAPPFVYKLYVSVCVALYPCLVLVGSPLGGSVTASGAHPVVGSLVTVLAAVSLLVFLVGPVVARSMQPWLSDHQSGECGCLGASGRACCQRGCFRK